MAKASEGELPAWFSGQTNVRFELITRKSRAAHAAPARTEIAEARGVQPITPPKETCVRLREIPVVALNASHFGPRPRIRSTDAPDHICAMFGSARVSGGAKHVSGAVAPPP